MSRKGEAMLKEKIFELFWSHDSLSKAEVMTALSQEVSDAFVKRALLLKAAGIRRQGLQRSAR